MLERIHTVTRPAWASKWYENAVIVLVTVCISTTLDVSIKTWLTEKLRPELSPRISTSISSAIAAVFFAFLGTAIFWGYGRIKRFKPKTFVYLFESDKDKFVIGAFELSCDGEAGILRAEGFAYDLENSGHEIPRDAHQNPWHSLNIGASSENGKVTCYITFEFEKWAKRPYCHGLIQFEKLHNDGVVDGLTAYRGRIHAIDEPKEGHPNNLPVYAKVYGELVERGIPANEAIDRLNKCAPLLLTGRKSF